MLQEYEDIDSAHDVDDGLDYDADTNNTNNADNICVQPDGSLEVALNLVLSPSLALKTVQV